MANKILLVCALILLVGACAFTARGEFGRSLVLIVPALVVLEFVSRGNKQIK
jgi:hypothetical protein